MRGLGPIRRNTAFRIFALFCIFFFAADALDLRDELLNINDSNSYLDNNNTTGIQSDFSFNPLLALIFRFHSATASVATSGFQNMPCSNRAPPAWS